jgi:hypothetical protein
VESEAPEVAWRAPLQSSLGWVVVNREVECMPFGHAGPSVPRWMCATRQSASSLLQQEVCVGNLSRMLDWSASTTSVLLG